MKNTTNRAQRSFVVEYKSNRRQPKAGAKSIWGGADLKALSRAVADDMPSPKAVPDDRDQVNPVVLQHLAVSEEDPRSPTMVAMQESEFSATSTGLDKTVNVAIEALDGGNLTSQPKARRQRGSRRTVRSQKPSQTERSILEQPAAPIATLSDADILAILEMENRRLKDLLMDKLRAENLVLREMMQRFDA